MDRFYIASPIFNQHQLKVMRDITTMLKLLNAKYFSPYENSQGIWKGRAPKDCTEEERGQVLTGNIDNLHWASVLLAWVGGTDDGRTDTGVVWEMGYYKALSLQIVTGVEHVEVQLPRFTLAFIHQTDKRQNMNLMLAGTVDAVAFGPAQLHRAVELLLDDEPHKVRTQFHPDKQIAHERVPIV